MMMKNMFFVHAVFMRHTHATNYDEANWEPYKYEPGFIHDWPDDGGSIGCKYGWQKYIGGALWWMVDTSLWHADWKETLEEVIHSVTDSFDDWFASPAPWYEWGYRDKGIDKCTLDKHDQPWIHRLRTMVSETRDSDRGNLGDDDDFCLKSDHWPQRKPSETLEGLNLEFDGGGDLPNAQLYAIQLGITSHMFMQGVGHNWVVLFTSTGFHLPGDLFKEYDRATPNLGNLENDHNCRYEDYPSVDQVVEKIQDVLHPPDFHMWIVMPDDATPEDVAQWQGVVDRLLTEEMEAELIQVPNNAAAMREAIMNPMWDRMCGEGVKPLLPLNTDYRCFEPEETTEETEETTEEETEETTEETEETTEETEETEETTEDEETDATSPTAAPTDPGSTEATTTRGINTDGTTITGNETEPAPPTLEPNRSPPEFDDDITKHPDGSASAIAPFVLLLFFAEA